MSNRTIALATLGLVLLMAVLPGKTFAADAVRLLSSQVCGRAPPPYPQTCQTVIPISILNQPTYFWISAVDANGFRDFNFRGTVSFSSTDALADLPSPHTFVSGDEGAIYASVVFHTPGTQPGALFNTNRQLVFVSANGLSPATHAFSILGVPVPATPAHPIPAIKSRSLAAVILCLALSGIVFLRRRRPNPVKRTNIGGTHLCASLAASAPLFDPYLLR